MNIDITGALFTLSFTIVMLNSQCKKIGFIQRMDSSFRVNPLSFNPILF